MASTRLTKVHGTSGNRNKWTWSSWVKRSNISNTNRIFGVYQNASYSTTCYFNSAGQFLFIDDYNGSSQAFAQTNARYRDTNGFYHLVVTYDKDNATSADKLILYVNGERVSLATYTAPTQATTWNVDGLTMEIGAFNSADYFDGSISHIHFCDGYAYSPTEFGEFDANGVWKIKTSPSVTYGNNGFFILKDGNSVTDQSGNGNNFTVSGGTLTNTEDNPSNVFATYNPLMNKSSGVPTMSNGNLTLTTNSEEFGSVSSIGVSQGKWYCEIKWDSGLYGQIGITGDPITLSSNSTAYAGITADSWGWNYGGTVTNNNSIIATYSSFATSDILGIALDLDNNKLYFAKNGTWQNSADPAAGTNGIAITASSSVAEGNYFIFIGNGSSAGNATLSANFGNGYFGTTAVSTAGTNASGNGIFEYDVPTGYTALSTKGLNL
jgi:hypothetical protein